MLHMPSPMLLGSEAATPYQLYQAHIRQRATFGAATWNSWALAAGSYFVTPGAAEGGGMIGSSWGKSYEASSTIQKIILHGLPDRSTYLALVAAGTDVFFRTEYAGVIDNFEAVNRNGYHSLSSYDVPGAFEALRLRELIWWTGAGALKSDPFLQSAPTSYSVP